MAAAKEVRKEARRVALLMAKLCLNLPCFGNWMPAAYWELFIQARSRITDGEVLSAGAIRAQAEAQRRYLLHRGAEESVDQILEKLVAGDSLQKEHTETVRQSLLEHLRVSLERRTPEVLADAVSFRTARQKWTPFEQTDLPFRQLMVDVIQAAFSTTYRTGDWPRRFRSHPSRVIANVIASNLAEAGEHVDGTLASTILDASAGWEDCTRSFRDVVREFRQLVPETLEFEPPELDVLLEGNDGQPDDDGEES